MLDPMSRRRGALAAAVLASAVLLASCVGVDAEATVARDGSGRLKLRYAVSKMLVSLGALEANERLLPFPVSREDFERTVRGIPGLGLVSYAQKETEEDLVVDAELSFSTPQALAAFLDPKGERAAYSESGGERRLRLVLAEGQAKLDPDLDKLVRAAFAPYSVSLAVKLPSAAKSAGIGKSARGGLDLSYSSPVVDLVTSGSPVVWEIRW